MAQGGDSSTIKRAKAEQDFESRENSMREKPEQNSHSGTLEAVPSTSSSHHRREKSGYGDLPKDLKDMKIKDDHEDNAKVGF